MAKVTHKRKLALPMVIKSVVSEPKPITDIKPTVEWMTITPEIAIKWLDECNINNRAVREAHVARLAADMLAGKWRGRNGEPIKFDSKGRMFEGQHRCWACIQADVPFESLVIRGCEPEDYLTSGIGRPKSFADLWGPGHTEKNINNLAAGVRLVYFWRGGILDKMKDGRLMPTIEQLRQTLEENPGIRESVNATCGAALTRKIYPQSFMSLIHYVATLEGHNARVESFIDRLGTGLGLTADDPVYQLRRFMLAQKGPKPGMRRTSQLYVLALGIKAWNACKEERSLKVLKFMLDEPFPVL